MSGVYGHLARRGVQAITAATSDHLQDKRIKNIQSQAQPYENSPQGQIAPWQAVIVLSVALVFVFVYLVVQYSLSEVMSSLVMIEQPRAIVLTETKPVESGEPDAPLEKDGLLDEEITVFTEKPVTSSIRKTMHLLHSIGGFRARFRGLGVSISYHVAHNIATNFVGMIFGILLGGQDGPFNFVVSTIIATVLLSPIHMTWTHVMISKPSQLPWFKRVPQGKKYFKALLLPSLVVAFAQFLVLLVPFGVATMWGGIPTTGSEIDASNEAMRGLATFGALIVMAFGVLLPASVTLTRVEASLLPDTEETIVNFDRTLGGAATFAITDNDINTKALFDAAWRSVDFSAKVRLARFYIKSTLVQTAIVLTGIFSVGALVLTFGMGDINSFVV